MIRKIEIVESVRQELDIDHNQILALHKIGRDLYRRNRVHKDPDKTMVDCTMSSAGKWSLTVENAAGVISIPGLQIVVRPKIPVSHLVYLFSRANILPRFIGNRTSLANDASFVELVIAWFIDSAFEIIRSEPLLDYIEEEEMLSAPRGKLNELVSAREIMCGKIQFFCRNESHSINNSANRLLKAAIEVSLSMLPRGSAMRKKALLALSFLNLAGTLQTQDLQYEVDRRFAHYRDPVILAKAVLSGAGRSVDHGLSLGWSFLIRTPNAIEVGIREVLRSGLRDFCDVYARTAHVGNGYNVSPDLWFDPSAAVADIKYKLTPKAWARPDLYQCVAYAAALKSNRASILSFHDQIQEIPKPVKFGSIAVAPLTWSTNASDPEEAAKRLCESAVAWLSSDGGSQRSSLVLYGSTELHEAA